MLHTWLLIAIARSTPYAYAYADIQKNSDSGLGTRESGPNGKYRSNLASYFAGSTGLESVWSYRRGKVFALSTYDFPLSPSSPAFCNSTSSIQYSASEQQTTPNLVPNSCPPSEGAKRKPAMFKALYAKMGSVGSGPGNLANRDQTLFRSR